MLFWILVAVLTAAVAVILLYPLLRGAKAAENSRAGEAAEVAQHVIELPAEGPLLEAAFLEPVQRRRRAVERV